MGASLDEQKVSHLRNFWGGITLTGRSNTVRITQKGQVTIPQEVRNQLGLLPYTEVEFEIGDGHARIRKAASRTGVGARGQNAVNALWGAADTRMSTDEIMALTRGDRMRGTRRRAKK